jgi:hypothetical protein
VFLNLSASFASIIWQAFVTAFARASPGVSNSFVKNCCHDSSKTPSAVTEKLAVNRLLGPFGTETLPDTATCAGERAVLAFRSLMAYSTKGPLPMAGSQRLRHGDEQRSRPHRCASEASDNHGRQQGGQRHVHRLDRRDDGSARTGAKEKAVGRTGPPT